MSKRYLERGVSAKKEDVIFNGSQKRKPLSFCEASMVINNNRDILAMEYNDVEITRRLFRSGESEFYINKTPCRLKDIHNLSRHLGPTR